MYDFSGKCALLYGICRIYYILQDNSMRNNYSKILPTITLLSGAALAALSGLFIKKLPYPTAPLLGFRFGVPLLVLLPYVIKRKNWLGKPGDRLLLWGGGFLNLVRMVLYIIAFRLTTMGNAVVLLYLWPVFALGVTAVIKRKIPDKKNILVITAAFAGVVLMNIHRDLSLSSSDLFGSLSMILSAFIMSLSIFIYKESLSGYTEGEVIYFQNSLGAVVFIPFLVKDISLYPSVYIMPSILYGFVIGIFVFMLFFFALKRVSVFHYSIMTYSEIIFAVMFGMVFFGETLVPNQIIGMLIVIASSFTAQGLKADNS